MTRRVVLVPRFWGPGLKYDEEHVTMTHSAVCASDRVRFRRPASAPNNGNNCSVLDPNCTKPSALQNYGEFLACENAYLINSLGQGGKAKFGALTAGAVGMQQMYTYAWGTSKVIAKAGLKKGVPVIGEIAALFDAVAFDITMAQANQTCTQLVYGQ